MERIILGNQSGPYYRQWAFDLCVEFAQQMLGRLAIEGDVNVSYDAEADFTLIAFRMGGRAHLIRHYKVFTHDIDGARCPACFSFVRSDRNDLICHLLRLEQDRAKTS